MEVTDGQQFAVKIKRTARCDKMLTHFYVIHHQASGEKLAIGEASHVSQLEADAWSAITYYWRRPAVGQTPDREYVYVKSQIVKSPGHMLVKKEDFLGPFADDEEYVKEDFEDDNDAL